jgi:hypothetical protein
MKVVRFAILEHEGEQSQFELPEHSPHFYEAIRALVERRRARRLLSVPARSLLCACDARCPYGETGRTAPERAIASDRAGEGS